LFFIFNLENKYIKYNVILKILSFNFEYTWSFKFPYFCKKYNL